MFSRRREQHQACLLDRHPTAQRRRCLTPGTQGSITRCKTSWSAANASRIRNPLDARHPTTQGSPPSRRERRPKRTASTSPVMISVATPWLSESGNGKTKYETRILDQLKRMGCSCDWERLRHARSDAAPPCVPRSSIFSKTTHLSRQQLVNWDTFLQTACPMTKSSMKTKKGTSITCVIR